MIRIGTDCSGIEAPIQAFMRLNIPFRHVFSSDIDKHIKKVVTEIYKPEIFYDDLMLRDNSNAPRVDLYIAGFPCQAFSMAGKRKGFDDIRGSVFFGVADYIRQQRPKVFILENVKGLLSHEKGRTFQTILEVLGGNGTVNAQMSIPFYEDGLDYHIHWEVLNTKEHGVPQNRERVFIVGFHKQNSFSFPIPEPLKTTLKDVLEPNPSDKYFLSEKLISWIIKHGEKRGSEFRQKDGESIADCLNARYYKCGAEDQYIRIQSNTKKGYDTAQKGDSIRLGHINGTTGRGRVVKGLAHTIQGSEQQAVITELSKYQGDKVTQYSDNTHPCLAAQGGNKLKGIGIQDVNFKIRRLTPLECFRLQDFPDSFHEEVKALPISDTQRYKMAGNSMTVRVIEKIFRKIYEQTNPHRPA